MAKSNAPGLALPRNAINQLERLIEYIDRMDVIVARMNSAEIGVSVFQVLEPLSADLGISVDHLEDVIYALENLRFLERSYGSPEDVFSRIVAGLNEEFGQKFNENRSKIVSALQEYSKDNPISTTFKAQKLAYLHERILRGSEVITDVRPVFDGLGEKVLELIVAQTLVISFSAHGRNQRLHFAMDAGDIVELKKACERAIAKASTLSSMFAQTAPKIKVEMLRGGSQDVSS